MSDIQITTLDISLNSALPPVEQKTSVSKYIPPTIKKKGRKYEPKDRMTYGPYLESMFYDNEIEAYLTIPKTDQEHKFKFLNDHKSNYQLRNRFKTYKETIGNLRSRYHRRTLYSLQEPVYLLSFSYDENGTIVVDGRQFYKFLTFKQAYERCLEFKIADPRFIEPDKIVLLRDRQNSSDSTWSDWSVPPDSFIASLEKKIGMQLYDSIQFPTFCTREETMK